MDYKKRIEKLEGLIPEANGHERIEIEVTIVGDSRTVPEFIELPDEIIKDTDYITIVFKYKDIGKDTYNV